MVIHPKRKRTEIATYDIILEGRSLKRQVFNAFAIDLTLYCLPALGGFNSNLSAVN